MAAAQYTSKHGTVRKSQYELFMSFVDMRRFADMLPESARSSVKADYDTINISVKGISIGVKVQNRVPYSLVEYKDDGAPFHFNISVHCDPAGNDMTTDFWIEVSAELSMMMKMMLGGKIKDALDKIVDGLVDPSSISVEDLGL